MWYEQNVWVHIIAFALAQQHRLQSRAVGESTNAVAALMPGY